MNRHLLGLAIVALMFVCSGHAAAQNVVVMRPVVQDVYSPVASCCTPAPVVTYSPVVTAAPVTTYYAPTTAYYAPTTAYYAPTTAYYAPTTAYYAPTTAYYAPTTAYYAPTTAYYAPTTAYYAPATAYYASGYTPVVAARPVIVRQKVYVPGQPIRNVFRAMTP